MSEDVLDEYEETFPLVDHQIELFATELEILVDLSVEETADPPPIYQNCHWTAEGGVGDGPSPRNVPKQPTTEELEPEEVKEECEEPEAELPVPSDAEIEPKKTLPERDHYAEYRAEFKRLFESKDVHWIDKTEELLWLMDDAPSEARLRSLVGDTFDKFSDTMEGLWEFFDQNYSPLSRIIPTGGFTARPRGWNDFDARIRKCNVLVKRLIVANQARSAVVKQDQTFAKDVVFPAIRRQGGYIDGGSVGEDVAPNIYGTRVRSYHAESPELISEEVKEKLKARKREEETAK